VKIVHVSTVDAAGGAARAAYRLHDGLKRAGEESRMFVAWKTSDDAAVSQFRPSRKPMARIARTLRRMRIDRDARAAAGAARGGYSMFSDDRSQFAADPWAQLPAADVVQMHWVAGFVDYAAFFEALPRETPVVWTLHDMNAFTGGCHYDAGCGRFAGECGACPALASSAENDLSRQIWRRKRRVLDALTTGKLHVVTPSRWLAGEAKRSALFTKFNCSVIPYGLDTNVFQPRDARSARERIGIPPGAKVILFLADGVDDPRKGYEYLVRALDGAAFAGEVFLLTLGRGKPAEFRGFRHVHLEAVTDDRMLAEIYSAADVFVAPSLQDNLPNTVLEASACGTPVIAFNAGGISEAVRHGKTGLLVDVRDADGLRAALSGLLANDAMREEMRRNCRAVATAEYAIDIQARRYVELYGELAPAAVRGSLKAGVGVTASAATEAAAETSRV